MDLKINPVLIVGAGPTGLVLALWLSKIGIKVRIIDKATETWTTSRALVIHARTLELYRQLGIADEVVERGLRFPNINLWVGGHHKAQVSIGDIGKDLSPYPYMVIFPQDQHEKLLRQQLQALGVTIEYGTELIDFKNSDTNVQATIKMPSGVTEDVYFSYLAGCDGAKSSIRRKLDTEFQGSTYPSLFYVADIVGRGPAINGELHVSLDDADFLAVFPLKQKGHARFIGVAPEPAAGHSVKWEDVGRRLMKEMDLHVDQVNWFSTYHVHHRVASHFDYGRVFLLGDAGHIHSPVGGQGMNTGIGDACNLAWKLGEVIMGRAGTHILKSYEPERLAFAQRLVATVDQAFLLVTSKSRLARWVRMNIIPRILPRLFSTALGRKFLFRNISQTAISYRDNNFNIGTAGDIHAGDRLPWIASVDNFKSLQSLSWQLHIYGDRFFPTDRLSVPIHIFSWTDEMRLKGLQKNTAYLVRPDGYIGMISDTGNINEIRSYLLHQT